MPTYQGLLLLSAFVHARDHQCAIIVAVVTSDNIVTVFYVWELDTSVRDTNNNYFISLEKEYSCQDNTKLTSLILY